MKNWLISGTRAIGLFYIFLLVQSFLVTSSNSEPDDIFMMSRKAGVTGPAARIRARKVTKPKKCNKKH